MMGRCPNCKARYRQGDSCRRCGMDLSWLLKINASAERIKQEISRCLVNGEYDQAKRRVQQHQQLIHDPGVNLIGRFLEKVEDS